MFFFAEIQRSLSLESEKVERIPKWSPSFSSLPHFKDRSEIYIFLLLANDFSNKNINYNQLLSDAEFIT